MTAALLAALALTATAVAAPAQNKGSGEVWVTGQGRSQLFIVHGFGSVETVSLPAGAGPHSINFSPDGEFAYVANVVNGDLIVLRADDRQVVATLDLGGGLGTHQAAPSPDGTTLLVSQITTKTLFRVSADEATETWTQAESLVLASSPVCAAFRADGQRAYVSLSPSGIAVVDLSTSPMTLVTTLSTAGAVQCGLVNSKDAETIYVDSNEAGGHFYLLDTSTDTLTEVPLTIGAVDLHAFGVAPNEKTAFAASRGTDELKMLDLTGTGLVGAISLDPQPGIADMPDMIAVRGSNVYVTLRLAGKLAIVSSTTGVVRFIDLTPAVIAPAVAVHGVAVRP